MIAEQLRRAKASPALIEQVVKLLAAASLESDDAGACPHCLGSGRVFDAGPIARLRAACIERNIHITGDDRIREAPAADLMGIKCKTLRNWRYALDPRTPDHVVRNGQVFYALASVSQRMAENSCPQVPSAALDSLAALALIVDNGGEHEGFHDEQPRFHKSQHSGR